MDEVYIRTQDMAKWVVEAYFDGKDLISIDDLICRFEDLASDYESLYEKHEDFKQNVEDNYRFVGQAEQVGISDRDFIEVK